MNDSTQQTEAERASELGGILARIENMYRDSAINFLIEEDCRRAVYTNVRARLPEGATQSQIDEAVEIAAREPIRQAHAKLTAPQYEALIERIGELSNHEALLAHAQMVVVCSEAEQKGFESSDARKRFIDGLAQALNEEPKSEDIRNAIKAAHDKALGDLHQGRLKGLYECDLHEAETAQSLGQVAAQENITQAQQNIAKVEAALEQNDATFRQAIRATSLTGCEEAMLSVLGRHTRSDVIKADKEQNYTLAIARYAAHAVEKEMVEGVSEDQAKATARKKLKHDPVYQDLKEAAIEAATPNRFIRSTRGPGKALMTCAEGMGRMLLAAPVMIAGMGVAGLLELTLGNAIKTISGGKFDPRFPAMVAAAIPAWGIFRTAQHGVQRFSNTAERGMEQRVKQAEEYGINNHNDFNPPELSRGRTSVLAIA